MHVGHRLGQIFPTLLGAILLGGAWYGWHLLAEITLHAPTEATEEAPERGQVVTLPAEKFAAADIKTSIVENRPRQVAVSVPGRLAYDDTQHIEVRVATAGVITKMHVSLGEKVSAGQMLATLSSPEVGSARADELQRAAELELAKRQSQWDSQRAVGIRGLVEAIRSGKSPAEIRQQFSDQQLGTARESLLSAYSNQILAQSMNEKLDTVVNSGALSTRTVEERRRAFDATQATLQATIEQTIFDATQAEQTAQLKLADAERRWQISRQNVVTLLGQAGQVQASENAAKIRSEELSIVQIHAPKGGWIEQKPLNENERVELGTPIFVIADTTKLWLRADLRESQWSALALTEGQELSVTSPALSGPPLKANVLTMGREVDPHTNTISLLAVIDNPYGQLKPGLFVRVELPLGTTENKLMIPESALAQHDGQTFVFIAKDKSQFVRRDVKVAEPDGGWVEVLSGLQPGEQITIAGVFALKSELLLESED